MVLVAGSANLDFVIQAPHIPCAGETVMGRGFTTLPGGKGANQAVACARSGGAATQLLAALGTDALATPIEASLHEAGVTLHGVRVPEQPTGACSCRSRLRRSWFVTTPARSRSRRATRTAN